eukprot:6205138-Pleurochrysis_carterae.AAC.4
MASSLLQTRARSSRSLSSEVPRTSTVSASSPSPVARAHDQRAAAPVLPVLTHVVHGGDGAFHRAHRDGAPHGVARTQLPLAFARRALRPRAVHGGRLLQRQPDRHHPPPRPRVAHREEEAALAQHLQHAVRLVSNVDATPEKGQQLLPQLALHRQRHRRLHQRARVARAGRAAVAHVALEVRACAAPRVGRRRNLGPALVDERPHQVGDERGLEVGES